ncbi:helix-turn-helix transcriptional regulator [Adlercreutzia sp. R25]|uniref:Helix-turn-helix transcriptional regulator n=1 Tax=Adlercreutzia shanghongiae TaxID=3111773 RepID=A0ABU6IVY2_9ACTN|nr:MULTISPECIES: helix-turn-helix transcriptional regulator [unclassified Adlercreutzia]MEC4272257.1 helix-turn-helix transcriptional regulator [Adlercreutzia sp. R25]MEC4293985.1 helix-turn-helix transcriptional regulator [Adlercreutzia sp. R22]
MELPEQLKANRERLGLSQEDVAHEIYVSRQTMSSWENGKTYPDVQSLLLLSQLFSVSIDELVKGDVISMKNMISKDAVTMERMSIGSAALILMGVACMVGLHAVWQDPTPVPYMTAGSLAGIAAMVVCWIPSLMLSSKIERIKKSHNLVTYREISAFMDGEEAPEDSDALSRRKPVLYSAVQIACGAGAGLIVAFALTLLVNALR